MQHGMNARITVLAHPARDVDKPPRVLVFGPPSLGGVRVFLLILRLECADQVMAPDL